MGARFPVIVFMREIVFANGEIVLHGTLQGKGDRGVVLCPPYPPGGGNRGDTRLVRVADALAERGIVSLRFDYRQEYSGGRGEVSDARAAVEYLRDRCSRVGLLGYSFGAVVASNLADMVDTLVLLSVLRDIDDIDTNPFIDVPLLMVHGERDDVAPAHHARELSEITGGFLVLLDAGHFYDGAMKELVGVVVEFFDENL